MVLWTMKYQLEIIIIIVTEYIFIIFIYMFMFGRLYPNNNNHHKHQYYHNEDLRKIFPYVVCMWLQLVLEFAPNNRVIFAYRGKSNGAELAVGINFAEPNCSGNTSDCRISLWFFLRGADWFGIGPGKSGARNLRPIGGGALDAAYDCSQSGHLSLTLLHLVVILP